MMREKIVILGGGESGTAAALLAQQKGYEVFLSDSKTLSDAYRKELRIASIVFEEGQHSIGQILKADLVVKSPGIPDSSDTVQAILKKDIAVISEIEFASRFTQKPIIAITGTNGKTTTTSLTHHLLVSAGLNAGLGGNIGHAFARLVLNDKSWDYYVLEVSSFQLDNCFEFKPSIAVITNITPDHLDRYDYKLENYIASKFRITQSQNNTDQFFYCAGDPHSEEGFQRHGSNAQTSFISRDQLRIDLSGFPLKGLHNEMNLAFAVEIARAINISYRQIEAALPLFKSAPHRLEKIDEFDQVAFYNDSKATNVEATYYALESFEKIIWIAGGIDKGNDYEKIKALVQQRVRQLIALGTNNESLISFFEDLVPLEESRDMQEAIGKAFSAAQPGDTVLLSPACASFDLFRNYEDRGRQFCQAVENLKNKVSL